MDLAALAMTTMGLNVLQLACLALTTMKWLYLLGTVAMLWSHVTIPTIGCWVVELIPMALLMGLRDTGLRGLYLEIAVNVMIEPAPTVLLFVAQFGHK